MKKYKLILAIPAVAMLAIFSACGAEGAEPDTRGILSRAEIEAAPLIAAARGQNEEQSQAVARGANDFAFALGAALLEIASDAETENFVVSPYSVWLPLAALMNATSEEFRPVFMEIIAAYGIDVADINRAASRMLFDLTNERNRREGWGDGFERNPLYLANAVFADYSHELNPDFAQAFADYFRGEAMNVNFSSPNAVAAVNQWASDSTNGHIYDIIQAFDPDTSAAIANAIYFSDKWFWQFNPDNTERRIFHAPAGDVYVYFMTREWRYDNIMYFQDAGMQSITLPFATGGGLTILLPDDGDAVNLLAKMTSEDFESIHENSVEAQGKLLLPRFSVENTLYGLIDALSAMGMSALFCEMTAPLDGLISFPFPAWIDQAVQVAMLEIDEEGATAAAVTVMATILGSAPPAPAATFEMICDTPFAFVLHRPTIDGGRQILFTGVVNNPKNGS